MSTPTPKSPIHPPTRTSAKVVAILTICFGAFVLTGTVGGATISAVIGATSTPGSSHGSSTGNTSSRGVETYSVDVSDVDQLDLRASASQLTIEFDDVAEATLETTSIDANDWTLETSTDGSELKVSSPNREGVNLWSELDTAVLTLPESLEGIDAYLNIGAGRVDVEGDFGALNLTMSAGELWASGSARSVTASVSAGDADLDFTDASAISLNVSAGQLYASFDGDTPDVVDLTVSAGYLNVELPDATYDVDSAVNAGSLSNDLSTSSSSAHRVDITVSAGSLDVR